MPGLSHDPPGRDPPPKGEASIPCPTPYSWAPSHFLPLLPQPRSPCTYLSTRLAGPTSLYNSIPPYLRPTDPPIQERNPYVTLSVLSVRVVPTRYKLPL